VPSSPAPPPSFPSSAASKYFLPNHSLINIA
jgi:hypothetical protein